MHQQLFFKSQRQENIERKLKEMFYPSKSLQDVLKEAEIKLKPFWFDLCSSLRSNLACPYGSCFLA